MKQWLEERTLVSIVAEATRWLRKSNIDLMFVPVPTPLEVYPESFIDASPAAGPVSPNARKKVWSPSELKARSLCPFPT
jgi:hypothetical protein